MNHEEWLKKNLGEVMADIDKRTFRRQTDTLEKTIPATVNLNLLMVQGKVDLAVPHAILAAAYMTHLAMAQAPYARARTMTDEDLKALCTDWTLADMEALFSIIGIVLWRALWREK